MRPDFGISIPNFPSPLTRRMAIMLRLGGTHTSFHIPGDLRALREIRSCAEQFRSAALLAQLTDVLLADDVRRGSKERHNALTRDAIELRDALGTETLSAKC